LLAALPWTAPAAQDAAAIGNVCGAAIVSCGCTITKPGTYTVSEDLSASSGLTPKDGCIDVKAAKVKLLLQGHTIQGSGAGIGLHLLPGAKGAFVEGQGAEGNEAGSYALFKDWDTGIRWEAAGGVVDHLQSNANTSFGIVLSNAKGNDIGNYSASGNGIYGTWLIASSGNQINSATSGDNQIVGIYLGCSSDGPTGSKCKGVAGSNGNRIYNVHAGVSAMSSIISKFGIVIDLGNGGNLITDAFSHMDKKFDLVDLNPGCGTNIWFANQFDTESSDTSCIK
jgi:hypothetical protein